MAHGDAESEDISYSHTLKKLFRVDVEKGPRAENAARLASFKRSSRLSTVEQIAASPAAADSTNGTQGRANVATPFARDRPPPTAPGMTGAAQSRRVSYHPPRPELPASFMRAPRSAPTTSRRRPRGSFTAESAGQGAGPGAGRGSQPQHHGSAWPAGGESSLRQVASLLGQSLPAAPGAAPAAGAGAGAGRPGSPRLRTTTVSNLSYKPPGSVTAEPAAAVRQRRSVAFAMASRGAGGGGGLLNARASWPASNQGPMSSAGSALLGSLGLMPGEGDVAAKAGTPYGRDGPDDVGSPQDGAGSGVGILGIPTLGDDATTDVYDSNWPLSNWRGTSVTLDGNDGAGPDGAATEAGGVLQLPYSLRAPRGRGPGPSDPGRPLLPSPFAPPQQLYHSKAQEEAAASAPLTTVGTIAAAAAAKAASYTVTEASMPSHTHPRIPNLDLALLRSTSSSPVPPAVGAADAADGAGRPAARGSDVGQGGDAAGAPRTQGGGGGARGRRGVEGEASDGDSDVYDDDAGPRALSPVGSPLRGPLPPPLQIPSPRSRPASLINKATPMERGTSMGAGVAAGTPGAASMAAGAVAASAAAASTGGGGGGSGGGAAATADGGPDAAAAANDAQARSKRRSSVAMDNDGSVTPSAPSTMGDTTKTLQVGISVAALLEIIRQLGPSQRHATTAEVVAQWLLPPTRHATCRFLDLIIARLKIPLGEPPESSGGNSARGAPVPYPVLHPDRTWFGPPDFFVIHAWSGNFMALVTALRDFCSSINKTPSSTYVWLDFVAVNQHPGRRDKKDLIHCRQTLAASRKALLVLDPLAESLTRLWCLYEVWLATVANPGASPTKLTLLNAGADWDAMADSFFRIDLSRCAASSSEDRGKLLEDMIKTTRAAAAADGAPGGKASGTTISPYGVVAALPQLSAAVRNAVFEAVANDLTEARRSSRTANGMLAYLDAVERYAMVRRLAGGHVEAEEQLEAAVAAAMGISGGKANTSVAAAVAAATATVVAMTPATTVAGTTSADAAAAPTASDAAPLAYSTTKAASRPASPGKIGSLTATAAAAGGGTSAAALTASALSLPPIYAVNKALAADDENGNNNGSSGGNNNNSSSSSNTAMWRKRPTTLTALAVLQAEHGRVVQALTHVAMALSCVPGLGLMRPAAQQGDDGEDGDDRRRRVHHSLSLSQSAHYHGRAHASRASHNGSQSHHSGHEGHLTDRSGRQATPPAPAPGVVAWKGPYWELSNPQSTTPDSSRAIFMASMVEAACGRHEAAAQLALQAGLARAYSLGPAHPITLATRRAAVPHLLALGRIPEAQLLAKSLLRDAVAEHGETHPSVGICHGAMAQVLAAQNKPEQAYSSAQRGAEVLATCLGRAHPATLDALQQCVDMLESVQEYGKAVALMRIVVQGRSAPGAIRTSPASPAFLAPNNRLLHLRTIAALEEKAVADEHSRRAMLGVMRGLSRLEAELRAALMAMSGPAPQVQRDLELVLMAQNKRYEAAMLRKGELR